MQDWQIAPGVNECSVLEFRTEFYNLANHRTLVFLMIAASKLSWPGPTNQSKPSVCTRHRAPLSRPHSVDRFNTVQSLPDRRYNLPHPCRSFRPAAASLSSRRHRIKPHELTVPVSTTRRANYWPTKNRGFPHDPLFAAGPNSAAWLAYYFKFQRKAIIKSFFTDNDSL